MRWLRYSHFSLLEQRCLSVSLSVVWYLSYLPWKPGAEFSPWLLLFFKCDLKQKAHFHLTVENNTHCRGLVLRLRSACPSTFQVNVDYMSQGMAESISRHFLQRRLRPVGTSMHSYMSLPWQLETYQDFNDIFLDKRVLMSLQTWSFVRLLAASVMGWLIYEHIQ